MRPLTMQRLRELALRQRVKAARDRFAAAMARPLYDPETRTFHPFRPAGIATLIAAPFLWFFLTLVMAVLP